MSTAFVLSGGDSLGAMQVSRRGVSRLRAVAAATEESLDKGRTSAPAGTRPLGELAHDARSGQPAAEGHGADRSRRPHAG